jgi:hypothetical protein
MTKAKLSKTEARQGETPGIVRYVLVISTAAAITALIVVFLVVI